MKKVLLLLLFAFQLGAQQSALPRSTPEAEGVSSEQILRFLDAVADGDHEFHSVMILRHGKVVAEGWWNPYRPDLKHTLYSVSKSFAATAVGFAVAEKRLTVNDAVVSFFPDQVPSPMPPMLADLKVKDLLSMSAGNEPDPTGPVLTSDEWVKTFFRQPIVHQPGTKFLYNTAATYMLSAIVQKVSGQKIVDYLRPRLFEPLGIEGMDWEVGPQNDNTGGWGLRLKTEDLAKFGQLFLQKGLWKGKQILPKAWIEEATSMKIMQNPELPAETQAASDWMQGYCYQMWRSRHNSYRADGAFGQYILVFPALDAVIAVTSETDNMQAELNVIWEHLLPAIKKGKVAAAPGAQTRLKTRLRNLSLPIPQSSAVFAPPIPAEGATFRMADSLGLYEQIGFAWKGGVCTLNMKTKGGNYQIPFGKGRWEQSETTRFGPYLVARAVSNRVGLPPFKTAGAYAWVGRNTLLLTLRYIESPHSETFLCTFEKDAVSVQIEDRFGKRVVKGVK